jgi:hypothetical protein
MKRTLMRSIERGDGDVFEFTIGILPLLMLTFLIAGVAIVRPLQLPVWQAARECARMASATLDPVRGEVQGENAGINSISNQLFGNVSGGSAVVTYDPPANGKTNVRGHKVTCSVSYTVDMTSLPIAGDLFGVMPMNSSVTMLVDPIKSDWRAN